MDHRREKTVITVETFSRTTIHTRRSSSTKCERCNSETAMKLPDEASALLQCTTREILRLAETGGIHFSETESGALLICVNLCPGAPRL